MVPFQICGVAESGGFGVYDLTDLLALPTTPLPILSQQRYAVVAT